MSAVPDLITAVVAAINGGTFAVPVTAQKDYAITIELEKQEGVFVAVTPGTEGLTATPAFLDGSDEYMVQFSMSVSTHVKSPGDQTEIENLLDLVAAIISRVQTTLAAATYIRQSRETIPLYDYGLLNNQAFFLSETTFTYKLPLVAE